jgi:glycosyltransferase involved in cell wall biosynthesis
MRGWARYVCPVPARRRFLSLVTDAFGNHGGIAQFNRDFLTALCGVESCEEVVALPRLVNGELEPMPAKLEYRSGASGGKLRYVVHSLGLIGRGQRYDLVVAGHINLLPVAYVLAWWFRCPLVLIIHGIDAWKPTRSRLANWAARRVDRVISVSRISADRFMAWSGVNDSKIRILPNCVDLKRYEPGLKPPDLEHRFALTGKTVLMTVGRLSEYERYKGFDEVIDALPGLRAANPNLVYLVCGEGRDRVRLEQKAKALGLQDSVVFTGFVPEERKADYYRLADAYVMPSRGEGFGIVILEALACGIPVVGSTLDGTREALKQGELGILVDPTRQQELPRGITRALARPKRVMPGLEYFSADRFRERVARLALELVGDQ